MKRIKQNKLEKESRKSFYIFIAPWLIGFLLFQLIPILWGFGTSLTNRMAFSIKWKFIGLDNYIQLIKAPAILYSFGTTFIYALAHTTLAIVAGLIIALLLEHDVPGRGFFRTILYFPYMIPVIAVSWIFKIFLDRDTGFFNIVLSKIGLLSENIAWVQQFPRGSIVSMGIWQSGWSMIIFLGGLATISTEMYEAARIDGAGYFNRLRRITIPLLSPFIFFQFVASMIYAMQTFIQCFILNPRQLRGAMIMRYPPPKETFFVMAKGYYMVITQNRFAYGIALLWLLFFIILLITIVFIRLGGFIVYSEVEEK